MVTGLILGAKRCVSTRLAEDTGEHGSQGRAEHLEAPRMAGHTKRRRFCCWDCYASEPQIKKDLATLSIYLEKQVRESEVSLKTT